MTNKKIKDNIRDTIIMPLDFESRNIILNLDNQSIPKLILCSEKNYRKNYCDIGSWCYSLIKNNYNNDIPGNKVDINSFRPDRILGVKALIENLISFQKSASTIHSTYKDINTIFGFINENYFNLDCSNINHAEDIYLNFTKYLTNIINLRNSNGLESTEHQKFKQEILAIFLSNCCGININHFYSKFKRIIYTKNKKQINKNEITQDVNKQVKILLEIFTNIYDFLINDRNLPLVMDISKYELEIAYIDVNLINKTDQEVLELFYTNNKMLDYLSFCKKLDVFYENSKNSEILELKKSLRKKYSCKLKRLNELNNIEFKKCNPKILLYNFMTIAFAKLLIAASGANESTLYQLELNSFHTISTIKGKRAYSQKNRANGKIITIEFGLKFKKIFDKYILIREKINKYYNENEFPIEIKNLLFIKLPIENNPQSKKIIMASDTIMFENFSLIYKKLFHTPAITNKKLRENFANVYFNQTNSSIMTSIRLGNTPKVANEHYAKLSFTEVSTQLSNYFEKFDNLILEKGRDISTKIPVHIIPDSKNTINIDTPIGHCYQINPKLADGFNNDIPTPVCGDIKSCLFCSSYVIHMNKTDIKKLISLKYIIEYNSYIKDSQQHFLYRINEIIELLLEKDSSLRKIIKEVNCEVDEGYLDEYWNNHLTMLFDIGKY